jgi:FkbM family methyltransferase
MGNKDKVGYKNRMFMAGFGTCKLLLHGMGKKQQRKALALLSEEIAPVMTVETKRGPIRFLCQGRIPLMRADTFHTKEPETLEWIDSFAPGSVLYDVGANVGVYTFYAALEKKNQVISFEPSALNYALLVRNVELNRAENVWPLCLALDDNVELSFMNLFDTRPGKSGGTFGEAVNWKGLSYKPAFRQAMLSYSVDELIARFNPPFPNHIKMDVDGNEGKIIQGAEKTLHDERLRSMLIELYPGRPDYDDIVRRIKNAGFKLKHTVDVNHIYVK